MNTNTKLSFITPTVLDEAFLFVMGASVKKTDNPIGYFGTGLKYAIAVTMRLGGDIVITTGLPNKSRTVYSFRIVPEQLRGEDMSFIMCEIAHIYNDNGDETVTMTRQRMPMTADYGKTWQPWMVLRELYSNTKDENGWVIEGDRTSQLSVNDAGELVKRELPDEYTRIVVDCAEVADAWQQKDKYFLSEKRVPMQSFDGIDVYYGESDTLFYKGIRVSNRSFKSGLTYNITLRKVDLTEDRTVHDWSVTYLPLMQIMQHGNAGIQQAMLDAATDSANWEHRLPYGSWEIGRESNESYAEVAVAMARKYSDKMPTAFKQQVWTYLDSHEQDHAFKVHTLDEKQQQRLDECLGMLRSKGIRYDDIELSFSYDVDGYAICRFKGMWCIVNPLVTLDAEGNWRKETCKTLIEEWVHLRKGAMDMTRDMQDEYNDVIYQLVLDGEVV